MHIVERKAYDLNKVTAVFQTLEDKNGQLGMTPLYMKVRALILFIDLFKEFYLILPNIQFSWKYIYIQPRFQNKF